MMKTPRKSIPASGFPASQLIPEMQKIKSADASWEEGRMFGYVYYPGVESARIAEEAYRMFGTENALNPSLFTSLKKFENEIVQMVTGLLNGGPESAGSFTSGGTESILLAVKTARDKARKDHPDIVHPEIIVPESAHPAFQKAAHYLDVNTVLTPVRTDKRADTDAMRKAVTSNTILLVGSAPCFPHGVIDPVREIGKIAVDNNIFFHVDACMGGMLIPFVEELGYPVPEFDFRVPGVTSISTDIHKYGYSPKGASVIIYADHALRKHQFFVHSDWSGGLYGSPTLIGSRSGGHVAAAWATLLSLGREGYLKMANEAMEISRKLQDGINSIEGLRVISNPDLTIFAFTSDTFDIFEIGDAMSGKNWFLDRIQFPNALHVTIAHHNAVQADNFLSDLKQAVDNVKERKIGSASSHFLVSFVKGLSKVLPETWFRKLSSSASKLFGSKDNSKHAMGAAMYGITAGIEDRGNVHELVLDVLDRIYSP